MNAQINQRTFTDQIPAYYEKTKFLRDLGRQDLADIHDYFFYKRLLYFYERAYDLDSADKKDYLEQLTQMIHGNREQYDRVFRCEVADPRDYKKMKLFLKSPGLYLLNARFNERVMIPLKVRVKRLLRLVCKYQGNG